MDSVFAALANLAEAFASSDDKPLIYALAAVVVLVLSWMLGRWKKVSEGKVDPYIDRNWRIIGGHVAIGAVAGLTGRTAVMPVMALSALAAVIWSERRASRRARAPLPAPYPGQRRWELMFLSGALVVAIATSLWIDFQGERRARSTQLLLLLAFEGVGTKTDALEATWSKFAANWNDVFGGVDGISVYPTVVSEQEFDALDVERDRRAVARRLSALKPDLVLKTTVKIPSQSIQLYSRVCDVQPTETRCTNNSFNWHGALDTVEHTALKGAADLLRHLTTLGHPPLSSGQHALVVKNILRRYEAFLNVQESPDDALVAKVKAAAGKEGDIPDGDVAGLLDGFDVTSALKADAQMLKTARNVGLTKLSVAR